MGRFLPVAILSPDRLVIGDSGHSEKRHRSTDACLWPKAGVRERLETTQSCYPFKLPTITGHNR
jgi:hypothetical protein